MAKVTSKRQVTIPKAIAEQYGIEPGDEITWQPAGDVMRVLPPGTQPPVRDRKLQVQLFDQATARQRAREKRRGRRRGGRARGWKREELYTRGRAR